MTTVLLLIHIMVALALVGVVLLQRSEGGALGIGGGGGFMTGRSAGNALTKTTAVLAGCFFATSLLLSILAGQHGGPPSILSPASQGGGGLAPLQMPAAPAPAAPSAPSAPSAPQAPQSQ
ncbi:MAG TPA: preprotein translocase subunit SecG [Methyloceanibacter sp.]|jgi:preprotein translocase subunit SecG|nr:preprotein translocase subunit SecG [Methyloceanibacter sp.]